MSLLNIRREGDPVLRQKAGEVTEITGDVIRLIDDMVETMIHNEGVGLAAPQVGVSQRIIVVRPDQDSLMLAFINPVIKSSSGEAVAEEGCLSIPEKAGLVSRAEKIVVSGLNRKGEDVSLEASGLLARIFQHEIDHLDGVLFTDKIIADEQLIQELEESKKQI